MRESLAAWKLRVPQLRTSWDDLHHSFSRSVADLASLRIRNGLGSLPAAGMPWFMTVFGRDTLITCLQTLLFGPELARSALEVLANLQATEDVPGARRRARQDRPRGPARQGRETVVRDLLRHPRRHAALPDPALRGLALDRRRRPRPAACASRRCARSPGSTSGATATATASSSTSSAARAGSTTSAGRTAATRCASPTARLAEPPIAPCEVQGYVYDAKLRTAELAREVWRDRTLAERLEREAAELKQRFDEAFWCDRGYYALALDKDKRHVDSLTSNIGHLLWSGIVPEERVEQLVDALMGEALWSGWGVRTMSTADAGYNPLAYHNGTVWPHDNSLCAAGFARYGRWTELHRVVRRMLAASRHFDHQLPEVFAGMPSADTPFPIRYPTAARPQAWAAGDARAAPAAPAGARGRPRPPPSVRDSTGAAGVGRLDQADGDPCVRARVGRSRREWAGRQ